MLDSIKHKLLTLMMVLALINFGERCIVRCIHTGKLYRYERRMMSFRNTLLNDVESGEYIAVDTPKMVNYKAFRPKVCNVG